jgi:hypothetical protein
MTICLVITNFLSQNGTLSAYDEMFSKLLAKYDHRIIIVMVNSGSHSDDEDEISEKDNIIYVTLKKNYPQLLSYYEKYFRPGGYKAPDYITKALIAREWLLKNHTAYNIDIIQTHDYGGPGIFLCDDQLPPLLIFGHGCMTQIAEYTGLKKDEQAAIFQRL